VRRPRVEPGTDRRAEKVGKREGAHHRYDHQAHDDDLSGPLRPWRTEVLSQVLRKIPRHDLLDTYLPRR
jgi:hypothetical protein